MLRLVLICLMMLAVQSMNVDQYDGCVATLGASEVFYRNTLSSKSFTMLDKAFGDVTLITNYTFDSDKKQYNVKKIVCKDGNYCQFDVNIQGIFAISFGSLSINTLCYHETNYGSIVEHVILGIESVTLAIVILSMMIIGVYFYRKKKLTLVQHIELKEE